jgi:hypothetical protein
MSVWDPANWTPKPKKSVWDPENWEVPEEVQYESVNPEYHLPTYDTQLSEEEEREFQRWKAKYAPNDSGADYDLRGAFKAGMKPGDDGHWDDEYKKPNHPTFSDESIYASERPDLAGHWVGDRFYPANPVMQDPNTTGSMTGYVGEDQVSVPGNALPPDEFAPSSPNSASYTGYHGVDEVSVPHTDADLLEALPSDPTTYEEWARVDPTLGGAYSPESMVPKGEIRQASPLEPNLPDKPDYWGKKRDEMTPDERLEHDKDHLAERYARGQISQSEFDKEAVNVIQDNDKYRHKVLKDSLVNVTPEQMPELWKRAESLPVGSPERNAADLLNAVRYEALRRKKNPTGFLDNPLGWMNDPRKSGEFGKRIFPFTGGMLDTLPGQRPEMMERIRTGKASYDDIQEIANYIVDSYQSEDAGKMAEVLDIVSHIPAFMGEMTMFDKLIGVKLLKSAGPVRRTVAASAAQAALSPGRVVEYANRASMPDMVPVTGPDGKVENIAIGSPKSFIQALPKGYLDAFIEVLSERTGAGIGKIGQAAIGRPLRRLGKSALGAAVKSDNVYAKTVGDAMMGFRRAVVEHWLSKPGRTPEMLREFIAAGRWNGMINEYFEERFGDVGRLVSQLEGMDENVVGQALTGQWRQVADQSLTEFLAFGTFDAAVNAPHTFSKMKAAVRGDSTPQEQAAMAELYQKVQKREEISRGDLKRAGIQTKVKTNAKIRKEIAREIFTNEGLEVPKDDGSPIPTAPLAQGRPLGPRPDSTQGRPSFVRPGVAPVTEPPVTEPPTTEEEPPTTTPPLVDQPTTEEPPTPEPAPPTTLPEPEGDEGPRPGESPEDYAFRRAMEEQEKRKLAGESPAPPAKKEKKSLKKTTQGPAPPGPTTPPTTTPPTDAKEALKERLRKLGERKKQGIEQSEQAPIVPSQESEVIQSEVSQAQAVQAEGQTQAQGREEGLLEKKRLGSKGAAVEKAAAPAPQNDPFTTLADAQRDKPEKAMIRVQRAMGGGVLNPVAEHVGDLTHRMSERNTSDSRGYEYVKDKVEKTLRWLTNEYGFGKEFNENIANNAKAKGTEPAIYRQEIYAALDDYAAEHRKLPAFNYVQREAQAAAVAIGERKFGEAVKHLQNLKEILDKGREAWVEEASKEKEDPPLPKHAAVNVNLDLDSLGEGEIHVDTAAVQKLVPGAKVKQVNKKGEKPIWLVTLPNGSEVYVQAVKNIIPTKETIAASRHRYDGVTDDMWQTLGAAGVFEVVLANGEKIPVTSLISLSELVGADEATLRHELIHWTRALGLWTDQEWAELAKKYGRGATEQDVIEERIAEGLGKHRPTWIGEAREFLRKFLASLGFELRADVRRLIASPEFWAREPNRGKNSMVSKGFRPAKMAAPPWYIKSAEVVKEKMGGKGTSDQIKAMLIKGGVKPEELEWMGLGELFESKPQVTKDEVLAAIDNGIRVGEKLRGAVDNVTGDMSNLDPQEKAQYEELKKKGAASGVRNLTTPEVYLWQRLREKMLPHYKYKEYTEPGGEDYIELLLNLSDFNQGPGIYKSPHWDEKDVLAHIRFDTRTDSEGKKVLFVEEIQSDWHQEGRKEGYEGLNKEVEKERDKLKAAYAEARRAADHALIDKNKFADEIASIAYDPHRDGRTWRVGEKKTDDQGREFTEWHRGFKTREEAQDFAYDLAGVDKQKKDDLDYDYYQALRDAENAAVALNEFNQKQPLPGGIPNAPFKKSSAWSILAMKRVIQWAAENGHEKIAWTTGEMQNKRYRLGDHVNSLGWAPYGLTDFTRNNYIEVDLDVRGVDGRRVLRVDKDTGKVEDAMGFGPGAEMIEGEPLSAVLGEELAGKILKEKEGEIDDLSGITVGGKGMIGFYDDILVNETNKFIKKFGGRGANVGLKLTRDQELTIKEVKHRVWRVRSENGDWIGEDFSSFEEARAWAINARGDSTAAHGFTLTPAMRDSALTYGQPLFSPPRSEHQQKKDALKRRIRQFFKKLARTTVFSSTGFDPELLKEAISIAIEAVKVLGIDKFKEYIKLVKEALPEDLIQDMRYELVDSWNAIRSFFPQIDTANMADLAAAPTKAGDASDKKTTPKSSGGSGTSGKGSGGPSTAGGTPVPPSTPALPEGQTIPEYLASRGLVVKEEVYNGETRWHVTGRGVFTFKKLLDAITPKSPPAWKNAKGEYTRTFYEEDPSQKIAEAIIANPRLHGDSDDPGFVLPVAVRSGSQPPGKVITARWEYTADEDTSSIAPSIAKHLDESQKQTFVKAQRAMDDPARGGFLDASGTGTGKSWVQIGLAKHYASRGFAVLIVSENAAIGKPWQNTSRRNPDPKISGSFAEAAAVMGVDLNVAGQNEKDAAPPALEGGKVYVTGYPRIERIASSIDSNVVLILDEAHALKNLAADTNLAEIGDKIAHQARSVLYATATPADKPSHIYFLERTGAWEGKDFGKVAEKLGLIESISERPVLDKDGNKVIGRDGKPLTQPVPKYRPKPGISSGEMEMRLDALFARLTASGGMIKHELAMDGVEVEVKLIDLPPEAKATARLIDEELEGKDARHIYTIQRLQEEPYKIPTVVEMVKEEIQAGRQVIVFVNRVKKSDVVVTKGKGMMRTRTIVHSSEGTAKTLKEELAKVGITNVSELHGDAAKTHKLSMDKFQKGETQVIIATIASGGTGINLDDVRGDAPRTMIVMTAPFTATEIVQAFGRVWRRNTKSNPKIRVIFGDSKTELKNRAIITHKLKTLGAVVSGQAKDKLDLDIIPESDYVQETSVEASVETSVEKSFVPPLQPVTVPPGPTGKPRLPTTKRGKKLLRELQKDARKTKGHKVGIRTINEYLLDLAETVMYLGKSQLSKTSHAHYLGERDPKTNRPSGHGPHIIRAYAGNRFYVMHEVGGHAISALLADRAPAWHADMNVDLRIFADRALYPDSMASANSQEEGWAELVRRFVMAPDTVPKVILDAFEDTLNKHAPEILEGLVDAQIAHYFHESRPTHQKFRTLSTDTGPRRIELKSIARGWDRFLFTVFGLNSAAVRMEKAIFKSIRGDNPWHTDNLLYTYNRKALALIELARLMRKEVLDTRADMLSSYQSTLRVSQEVNRLVDGAIKGEPQGIRLLVQGDKRDVLKKKGRKNLAEKYGNYLNFLNSNHPKARKIMAVFKRLGIDIPAAPSGFAHGEYAYLSDTSFQDIVDKLGGEENWEQFETYGQYKAAIHRGWDDASQLKGISPHDYPGLRDKLNPAEVKKYVAEVEAEHPEWVGYFKEVNKFFNQLLLVPLLSGEITPRELQLIVQKWDAYWPLPRRKEPDKPLARRDDNDPHSALFKAFGSELPFQPLKKVARDRVRAALEAYYKNRQRLAVKNYGDFYGGKEAKARGVPFQARKLAKRLMIPLKMDRKVAVTLTEDEQKKLIVEAVNASIRKRQKAGEDVGEDDIYTADDIVIMNPRVPIFRRTKPKMTFVVKTYDPFYGHQYWHVPDALTYDYMTKLGQPTWAAMKFISDFFGEWNKNAQRIITQSLPFAIRNIPRDIMTGVTLAGNVSKRQFIAGYNHALGMYAQLMHGTFKNTIEGLDATDLLSRQLDPKRQRRRAKGLKGFGQDFLDMLREGTLLEDGIEEETSLEYAAKFPARFVVSFSGVVKIADLINYATLGRAASVRAETSGRLGAFITERRAGMSMERAQYAFDTSYGNFAQKSGAPFMRELFRTAMFANPMLQILYGQYMQITDPDPAVRRMFFIARMPQLMAVATAGAAMNILSIMLAYPDPDDQEAIFSDMLETPMDTRLRGPRVMGMFQLQFDYGLTGAVQAPFWVMTENAILGQKMTPRQRKQMIKGIVTKLISGPDLGIVMPTGFKAYLELTTGEQGHDMFRDRPIVPEWMVKKYPDATDRFWPATPGFYKMTAKIGDKIPVLRNWLGGSPLKHRHLMSTYVSKQFDQVLVALQHPEWIRNEIPVVGQVFIREPSGWHSDSVEHIGELEHQYKAARDAVEAEPDNETAKAEMEKYEQAHFAYFFMDKLWNFAKAKQSEGDLDAYKEIKQAMIGAARAGLDLEDLDRFPNPWKNKTSMPREVRSWMDGRIKQLKREEKSKDSEISGRARRELRFWGE